MKITRMDLVGQDQRGNNIFAVLTRKLGSEYIEVEILSPGDTRRHRVLANDQDDQFSMPDALEFYLEVCYLDLNGPNNVGGIKSKEILREFPAWDPKGPATLLAPAIIHLAANIIHKSSLGVDAVKDIYVKKVSRVYSSLRLPLSPELVWPQICDALFGEEI